MCGMRLSIVFPISLCLFCQNVKMYSLKFLKKQPLYTSSNKLLLLTVWLMEEQPVTLHL